MSVYRHIALTTLLPLRPVIGGLVSNHVGWNLGVGAFYPTTMPARRAAVKRGTAQPFVASTEGGSRFTIRQKEN